MHALDIITRLEQSLSVYLPDSELSLLNREAAQTPVRVSESTFELMQLGIEVYKKT